MADEPKAPMRQIAELIDGIATARAESAESLLTMCEHQLTLARNDVADRDAQIARVKALLDSAISDCIDRDAEIARLKAALDSESTLRQCREEQLRLLHQDYAGCVRERNEARHEVETWQREYSGALADFEHAQAEIARLKEHVGAANETAGNAIREVIDLRRANAQLDAEIARLEAELAAALAANPTAPTTAVEVPRPATATEIRTYMDRLADQPRAGGYVPPSAPLAPPADDPRIAALVKPLCIVVTALVNHTWKRETDEGLSEPVCKAIAQIAWRE